MSDSTTPMKRCPKCGVEKPATPEYFTRAKVRKGGLHPYCKDCKRESDAEWRKNNPEKDSAYKRKWDENNRDKKDAYRKEYYRENREWYLEYSRQYNETNKERRDEQIRQWQKDNPEKVRAIYHRYIARKRGLPNTFTSEQWKYCLEYHHYCCAVCGCQLRDLFGNVEPQADHWIALSNPDCPGTVATNMICLCNSCNVTKSDIVPHIWLERKYGKRKAQEILQRIQVYFSSIVDT